VGTAPNCRRRQRLAQIPRCPCPWLVPLFEPPPTAGGGFLPDGLQSIPTGLEYQAALKVLAAYIAPTGAVSMPHSGSHLLAAFGAATASIHAFPHFTADALELADDCDGDMARSFVPDVILVLLRLKYNSVACGRGVG